MAVSNFWTWIDNFRYKILTLQNQQVTAEN